MDEYHVAGPTNESTRLKKMWSQGATASQIADELGGVSRNAVIGKAHRLGLKSRPSPVKPNEPEPKRQGAARKPRPPAAQAEAGAAAPGRSRRRAGRRRAPPQLAADMPRQPLPSRGARSRSRGSSRSAPAASCARARATSRRRSRRRRRAAWCRPSRAPRSPTRPACSISTSGSATGRWAIRASPISISAASKANPGFPYCVEHCGVAYQAQLPAARPQAAAAAAVRRAAGPLITVRRPAATQPSRDKSPA